MATKKQADTSKPKSELDPKKQKVLASPDAPGVYIHKDVYGEIIYVGKAKSLKKRLLQYFGSKKNMDRKVAAMVEYIDDFEYIVTPSANEALLLENTLIKKYMPRFNVMLRDDKTYPYIKITLYQQFPRIVKTRQITNDGSRYFGPYSNVGAVNTIIDYLNDIYGMKRCKETKFSSGYKCCLNGRIGRCLRPCEGAISEEDYREKIDRIIAFLSNQDKSLIRELTADMKEASVRLDFEAAGLYRDKLLAAKAVTQKQSVELLGGGDMDIVLAAGKTEDKSKIQVSVFFVRNGKLSGRELHSMDGLKIASEDEILSAFLVQYYAYGVNIPKKIVLERELMDMDIISSTLSLVAGRRVSLMVPKAGKIKHLLDTAKVDRDETEKKSEEISAKKRQKEEMAYRQFYDIIGCDDLTVPPRLEAYDISNTSGIDIVGAYVVFEGFKAIRSDYRRFRIKTIDAPDDYAAMQEIVYRRFKRLINSDKGFCVRPLAILIDGGLGHVHAVEQIFSALGEGLEDLRILGMVKDGQHRTRGLIYKGEEYILSEVPELFAFIGRIQEEVHRFAISYHRKLRSDKLVYSILDDIPGVGEKTRNLLLKEFLSVDEIRGKSDEELVNIGINSSLAPKILDYLQEHKKKEENEKQ